jgi:hypothetical protein
MGLLLWVTDPPFEKFRHRQEKLPVRGASRQGQSANTGGHSWPVC